MTGCNGSCETTAYAEKLLRAARRQLRNEEAGSYRAYILLGEIHILTTLLDGPTGERVVAPLVKPGAVCALPAEGAGACPS